jgi:hypothetical protein
LWRHRSSDSAGVCSLFHSLLQLSNFAYTCSGQLAVYLGHWKPQRGKSGRESPSKTGRLKVTYLHDLQLSVTSIFLLIVGDSSSTRHNDLEQAFFLSSRPGGVSRLTIELWHAAFKVAFLAAFLQFNFAGSSELFVRPLIWLIKLTQRSLFSSLCEPPAVNFGLA